MYTDGTCPERPLDWRDEAACLGMDGDLFFPVGQSAAARWQTERAVEVCNHCEVVDTCLHWALTTGQDSGVWGGMTEEDRRSAKRRALRQRARERETAGRA